MIVVALLVLAAAIGALGLGGGVAFIRLARKIDAQQAKADFAINALVNAEAEIASLLLQSHACPGVQQDGVICSLTTLATRLPLVHLAIESILMQSHRPQSVELYLSDALSDHDLPLSLTRLKPLGVNIHFVPDVGPQTKLIYALADFPLSTIVTVDDDIAYPSNTFATLLNTAARCPGAIVGNWARRLGFDRNGLVLGIRDGVLLTPPNLGIERYRESACPDLATFVYGTGGVLYPPGSLHEHVHEVAAFQRLCPTEDDIWFKAMALLKGTPAVHTELGFDPRHHTIRGSQAIALRHTNHDLRRNVAQMRAMFETFDLYRLFPKKRTVDASGATASDQRRTPDAGPVA